LGGERETQKQYGLNDRPHPNPLLRGEGFYVSRVFEKTSAGLVGRSSVKPEYETAAEVLPSTLFVSFVSFVSFAVKKIRPGGGYFIPPGSPRLGITERWIGRKVIRKTRIIPRLTPLQGERTQVRASVKTQKSILVKQPSSPKPSPPRRGLSRSQRPCKNQSLDWSEGHP